MRDHADRVTSCAKIRVVVERKAKAILAKMVLVKSERTLIECKYRMSSLIQEG